MTAAMKMDWFEEILESSQMVFDDLIEGDDEIFLLALGYGKVHNKILNSKVVV